jgi:hypothetical protein
MVKIKGCLYLTLGGEAIASFWFGPTEDGGLCFGPSIEDRDLHLTFWHSEGKFRYHIRHKGIKEPSDESPIGAQKSTKMILDKIQRMLQKRLMKYHGNAICWTFILSRWKKIGSILPKVDLEGNVHMPLEFLFAQVKMDFSKKRLWRKFRIRSLLTTEPYFGFIETKHGLRLVRPISKNQMLVWPVSRIDEIPKYLSKVLGFDDFIEYLESTPEGKTLYSQVENKLRQLSGL